MPIHVPGRRDSRGRKTAVRRNVVAVLSLTAMVDMFTVLAVFLLQNYNVTGQVLNIAQDVHLPEAGAVKELKPANVVIISENNISLNDEAIADYKSVKEQQDWLIPALQKRIQQVIEEEQRKASGLGQKLKAAVDKARQGDNKQPEEIAPFRKMTIQADKKIDFLTLKKVMYTVTEAGVWEINFAVLKKPDEAKP